MEPFKDDNASLYCGEALATLKTLPDASVDSIVTDPPSGIGFMGRKWDTYTRSEFIDMLTPIMAECLRVAKPGSYALAWALPRTSHWTGTAIEDAGWLIQDRISHLFGQGFPKHRSKLKPACEDWWLAWKSDEKVTPLPGLDACRIACDERPLTLSPPKNGKHAGEFRQGGVAGGTTDLGRWPANVTLDETAAAMLDQQSGELTSGTNCIRSKEGNFGEHFGLGKAGDVQTTYGDTGGASRFFYVAKATRRERNDGCEGMEKQMLKWSAGDQSPDTFQAEGTDRYAENFHPTVKPIELMRWLCRLITPPGGAVLDCFMGSGSTGIAALEEKFDFIGIERDKKYFEIAKRRITAPAGPLFECLPGAVQ